MEGVLPDIFRVQDKDGRGPYKPGMSIKWADKDMGHYRGKLTNLPPFMDEFPGIVEEITDMYDKQGGAFGCGFTSLEQLDRWFSKAEQQRMKTLEYHMVKIKPKKIIRSSKNQTVFWHDRPLAEIAEILTTTID